MSVLMRLHARNRCPGSFLAAAVNVGLGARFHSHRFGDFLRRWLPPVIRSRAAFAGSKLRAIADGRCVDAVIKELSL